MIDKRLVTSESQSGTLVEQYELIDNEVDFNVDGFTSKFDKFSLTGKAAIVNRVKFWLLSKPYDMVREPESSDYHTTITDLIGKRMDDDTLKQYENSLLNEFNNRGYSTDLELVYIHLTPNVAKRSMNVDFVVRSKANNSIVSSVINLVKVSV